MPKKSVVADFQGAAYEGVDFSKWVVSWKDTREQGVVMHTYIKRDGGEGENMGRPPHECQIVLNFVGAHWRIDALKLIKKLDEKPIGLLTHPMHGNMRCAAMGYRDAEMDIANALNFYQMPLRFVESAVDTKVEGDDWQGPTAKQQDVESKGTSLNSYATQFETAAALIVELVSAAVGYATDAADAANANETDPSLDAQLAGVGAKAQATIIAIRSDPAATTDATAYPAVALCEELYDSCVQLAKAIGRTKLQLAEYVVPMTIHITNLSRSFYGKNGAAREPEILANNARRIPDPGAIPRGTRLLMAPRTV
jgi:hypothetical protein